MSAILQDQDTATKDWYQQLFQTYRQSLNGQSEHPLAHFRMQGYEQFDKLAFPTRRDEDWKYSGAPIARMMENRYQQAKSTKVDAETLAAYQIPNLDVPTFVFVNGVLQEDLLPANLPAGVKIERLTEALQDNEKRAWIEEQAAQQSGTEQNTFLPLNQAFAQYGLYLETERNAQVETPLCFLHLSIAGEEAHFSHPQLFVRVRSGSQLSVIERYQATPATGSYFTNTANWFGVEDNAHCHHYKLQLENGQALNVHNTHVRQGRDSVYSNYSLDLGGKVVRNNLSTTLLDSNTNTNYYGVYLGNQQQHIDNQTFIDHAMPHCQSNELYKGILTDYARGVFNGKVMVRQDAQKTNAFQQNSSLVLSKNAIMDAKPQLEIFADDVKCSHGATIGQLDESSVFFLRTRGLSGDQARQLLQQAFLGEVIEAMPNKAVQAYAMEMLVAKLLG